MQMTQIQNLDQMIAFLKSDEFDSNSVDMANLPNFGGEVPSDTSEVWSWDESRLLVGTCPNDYKLVDRSNWELS